MRPLLCLICASDEEMTAFVFLFFCCYCRQVLSLAYLIFRETKICLRILKNQWINMALSWAWRGFSGYCFFFFFTYREPWREVELHSHFISSARVVSCRVIQPRFWNSVRSIVNFWKKGITSNHRKRSIPVFGCCIQLVIWLGGMKFTFINQIFLKKNQISQRVSGPRS